jgi:hypothetical protein
MKRFKSTLVLLLKSLVTFVFITVIYKGFNISTKLRPKLVIKKDLYKRFLLR